MSEAALVRDVADMLVRRGFAVRSEVSCLLPTWDGGDQKRRIDLYAKAPETWEHARAWKLIAIEAKRRTAGDMGGEIDGLFQTGSTMFARDFRHNGLDLPRPSIALYVDAESWTPEVVSHLDRESMLAERILWRVGASILRRDSGGWPYFIYAGADRTQKTYRFPA